MGSRGFPGILARLDICPHIATFLSLPPMSDPLVGVYPGHS